jgi:hypothetical protein
MGGCPSFTILEPKDAIFFLRWTNINALSLASRVYVPHIPSMPRFSTLALLLLAGCDLFGTEPVGSLYVTVRYPEGGVSEGALVTTSPATGTYHTNAFGTVLLEDVPTGTYTIRATQEDYGSGEAVLSVEEGRLNEAEVELVYGVFLSYAPTPVITAPQAPAGFAPGEEVTFSAVVTDEDTPPGGIEVAWASSLDGDLSAGSPNADGLATFTTSALSPGHHQIVATASDPDGHVNRDTVEVVTLYPHPSTLAEPVVEGGRVRLSWSPALPPPPGAPAFARYEVYRSLSPVPEDRGALLATLDDPGATTYEDATPPIADEVYYEVVVVNEEGYERGSGKQVAEDPAGLTFEATLHDAALHPTRPWLYLLDRGSSYGGGPSRILVFDYEAQEIRTTLSLSYTPGWFDLADNGMGLELYVPASDGWVYIYGADALNLVASINTGNPNTSVVADGRGHLYVSLQPSPWWERPLRTYDRATGTYIDGGGDFDATRLRFLPGNQEIIEITSGISPVDMDHYSFDAGARFLSHADDPYHGDHPLDPFTFRASPSGDFVITAAEGAVYTADEAMRYEGSLQRGGLRFADFAFDGSGHLVYAGAGNERVIQVNNYPSLQQQRTIATRAYPAFLFRRGGELIAVSSAQPRDYSYSAQSYIVERVATGG